MKRSCRWMVFVALALLAGGMKLAAQMHDHMPVAAGDGQFNPYVVADRNGGFDAAYVQRRNGKNNIFFMHAARGSNFWAPVQINDVAGDGAVRNENPPKLAVGPRGEIYAVWASERERWKGNIRFARSLDGGKTFSHTVSLNSDAAGPPVSRAFESIAVDSKGRILVAWIDERSRKPDDRGVEIWMAESDDRGRTFSRDRKILENVCECCRTALAVDADGRIFISYRTVPASGPLYRDIMVARSDDGGKTFKPVAVNHDGWELQACPIDGATMTVDKAGRVIVAWFTVTGDLPRLYLASSSDHGATFGKPQLLDSGQKLAKHAHIVAVEGNRVLAAWDDVQDGSLVKWGLFDLASGSLRILGSQKQASYPIVAAGGWRLALMALQPDRPEVFETILPFTR